MMDEAIKNFAKQLKFNPKIENKTNFKKYKKFLICGMGGSHLAGDLLKILNPELDLIVHSDYGLPELSEKNFQKRLVIISSYSGNTEEIIDGFNTAKTRGLPIIVIASGGKLIELAKQNSVAYIELPDTGIQARSALGFSLVAMLKATAQKDLLKAAKELSKTLKPTDFEQPGKALAEKLRGFVPVIYSSSANYPIAYNWKIKFNETGKIPAFCNALPELNHNEMTGFDVNDQSKFLSEKFYFILLQDGSDRPENIKRMQMLRQLYQQKNLKTETVELIGQNKLEKIFSSLLLADWAAFYTAKNYGLEPEQVPMVEEFKKLIS